jgi:glycine/D-amino acid oxidase-like deaminating enzyme
MLLCKAFATAARRRQAKIYPRTKVTDVCTNHGRVTGIHTSTGPFACAGLVNAAGTAADEIGRLAGCEIPIRKNRGTVVVTEPLPKFEMRHKAEGVDHAKFRREREARSKVNPNIRNNRDLEFTYDVHFTCTQTRRGHFLIGRSGEDHQIERLIKHNAIRAILHRAVRFVPSFSKVKIQRVYAGIRPYSPDLLPILGPASHPEGFFLACGFGDKGIGLGAAGVKHVVSSILDKSYRIPRAFDPQRFVAERLQ